MAWNPVALFINKHYSPFVAALPVSRATFPRPNLAHSVQQCQQQLPKMHYMFGFDNDDAEVDMYAIQAVIAAQKVIEGNDSSRKLRVLWVLSVPRWRPAAPHVLSSGLRRSRR